MFPVYIDNRGDPQRSLLIIFSIRYEAVFAAVDEIAAISSNLLSSLETNAPPRNRTEEAARTQARAAQRFSK